MLRVWVAVGIEDMEVEMIKKKREEGGGHQH
jgi:hypothetical protein